MNAAELKHFICDFLMQLDELKKNRKNSITRNLVVNNLKQLKNAQILSCQRFLELMYIKNAKNFWS